MNATQKLASLLRAEHRSIEVPRTLTSAQCVELLNAGLIEEFDDEELTPDRRYIATEYAADLIWHRI